MQLNKGDVIEVLNYAGFTSQLRDRYEVTINIERNNDRTGEVTVSGWQRAVKEEIPMREVRNIVSCFVEDRIRDIAEAKLEEFKVVLS